MAVVFSMRRYNPEDRHQRVNSQFVSALAGRHFWSCLDCR